MSISLAFCSDALAGWLRQKDASDRWRVLFEQRENGRIARVQFALAGVNAHINHDLCAAIVATCEAMGTPPDHWGVHYNSCRRLGRLAWREEEGVAGEISASVAGAAALA